MLNYLDEAVFEQMGELTFEKLKQAQINVNEASAYFCE